MRTQQTAVEVVTVSGLKVWKDTVEAQCGVWSIYCSVVECGDCLDVTTHRLFINVKMCIVDGM